MKRPESAAGRVDCTGRAREGVVVRETIGGGGGGGGGGSGSGSRGSDDDDERNARFIAWPVSFFFFFFKGTGLKFSLRRHLIFGSTVVFFLFFFFFFFHGAHKTRGNDETDERLANMDTQNSVVISMRGSCGDDSSSVDNDDDDYDETMTTRDNG
jgi:hypothetical protein